MNVVQVRGSEITRGDSLCSALGVVLGIVSSLRPYQHPIVTDAARMAVCTDGTEMIVFDDCPVYVLDAS